MEDWRKVYFSKYSCKGAIINNQKGNLVVKGEIKNKSSDVSEKFKISLLTANGVPAMPVVLAVPLLLPKQLSEVEDVVAVSSEGSKIKKPMLSEHPGQFTSDTIQ